MSALLTAALRLDASGLSVVPAKDDGSKRPFGKWKQYQTQRPTPDDLTRWLNGAYSGIGVITGSVSGQLEMFEAEGRAAAEGIVTELGTLMTDNGFGDLWLRICTGYVEQTPGGGLHWYYRISDGAADRNLKLARRPATETELAENSDDKIKVLLETRGEGGFSVTAPSAGATHPSGRAWVVVVGSPETIPSITVEERDALHAVAAMLDQMPVIDEPTERTPRSASDGLRPGDDYNQRADWADILKPHGWRVTRKFDRRNLGWCRPGKEGVYVSATTGRNEADNLYVFSSSTPFLTEKPYSKFGAYALLEHGGDYSAAAKALRDQGYGAPLERAAVTVPAEALSTPAASPTERTYTRSDDGNALRLVDAHQGSIRYCADRGQWLTWRGHHWGWDNGGAVNEFARSIARDLPAGEKLDERHRQASLSSRGLEAMVRIARTDPQVVTPQNRLDARPYEINTPAGVVNLKTAAIRPPDPAALHTRTTTVAPDTTTTPTRWLRFLADTFAGDPDLTAYVQRLLGISLIGQVLEQILPFAYGEGANGKTTLLGVVQRLVGIGDTGYAISAPAELLLATTHTPHAAQTAQLAGARLVVTSELDEGQRFAEAKVKQLTGRDAISAQFMRSNWFTFLPTHTLWLLANHQPAVRTGGPAFWRRLRLVPFLHTVPAAKRDPHLEDRLVEEEGPAILAWLIQGAADYMAHGLGEPASVRTATDSYERDQDTVARFVEEMCQTGDANQQGMAVKVAELRSSYESWCSTEGEQPVTQKALTLALRSRYDVESVRDMRSRHYRGIRLTNPSSDASSEPDDQPETWWQR